ncbi:hypothetical protein V6N11_050772 [Hibiscus sabdariffa]|uniref:Uncharacterized protein n=2 Tax=Hibiscus sabdariffa TaxID=183260 RepID=A0ABR2TAU8_9ROSI
MVKEKEATTNMEEKEVISKDKGLWHTFARHGNDVDSFIVRKPSRGGNESDQKDKVKPKSRHCEGEQAKFPHHEARPVETDFAGGSLNIPNLWK